MHKQHAIIVGAGPAGLTAAHYFLKLTDIKPIVIEQEKFVGGLSRTVEFRGNRMDIGGHKFSTKNDEVLSLWQKIFPAQGAPALDEKILGRESVLVDGGANPEVVDEVFLNRNFTSESFCRRKLFPQPVTLNFDTVKKFGLGEMFSIGASFLKTKFHQRDEKNLEDFMVNRFGQKFYEIFFRDYMTKILGRTPQEIDASLISQQLNAFSLGETSSEKIFYPKLGTGQFWEKFVAEIKSHGGEVLTSTKLKSFRVVDKKIRAAVVETPAGTLTFPVDYYLSSMPLAELANALDEKILPARPRQIAKNLSYRNFIIVGLLVDKMLLKNHTAIKTFGDIVPDCQIDVHEPSVKLGRLQIFNNRSPYLVADPKNSVLLGLEYFCNEGDELWRMSEDNLTKFAADELASIGIIDTADVRFGTQVKVPKAFPAYFDGCENISELRAALDEIENLYCIGRNGQHRCHKMDHSMLTAIAAVCAIAGKFSKADVWKVN